MFCFVCVDIIDRRQKIEKTKQNPKKHSDRCVDIRRGRAEHSKGISTSFKLMRLSLSLSSRDLNNNEHNKTSSRYTHTYEIIKEKKDLIEREAYGFVFVFSLVIRG